MRQKMLLLLFGLVCALGIFVPAVSADCTVTGGTAPNEIYTCDGTDADGVDVGTGEDTVNVVGTVLSRIYNVGGTLIVIIDPAGALNSSIEGIVIDGSGSVTSTGNINASDTGIFVNGNGSISSTGNITSGYLGIFLDGDGTVTSVGNIIADNSGIYVFGNGSITSTGNVTSGYAGIFLDGDGSISSDGDIEAGRYGIFLYGDGSVTSAGAIDTDHRGIFILGSGSISSTGDITAGLDGIYLINGTVTSDGNITAAYIGIHIDSNGNVTSNGNIIAGFAGIYLEGNGSITSDGAITAELAGILGGEGNQVVDVNGSVNAPLAVVLAGGNDMLTIRRFTVINGDVEMGDGDDVVVIENYVQVDGTIYGGEGAEVDGDLLVLGSGEFCSEDEALAAGLGIDTLDPNSGTTTYLGQTYTWEEFERLGREATVAPCIGKINDGRINAYDLGAPEALYCTVENGVSVWELDLDGQGTFSFAVSKAQIEAAFAVATGSGVNTLIGSDSFGNELYALSDGTTITFVSPELREPGKQYLFSFERMTCG